jgi:hypothetical protein
MWVPDLIKDQSLGFASLHKIQQNFKKSLSNTPNFNISVSQKSEVDLNFTVFMKQQITCFINRHFDLEVVEKLTIFATA